MSTTRTTKTVKTVSLKKYAASVVAAAEKRYALLQEDYAAEKARAERHPTDRVWQERAEMVRKEMWEAYSHLVREQSWAKSVTA